MPALRNILLLLALMLAIPLAQAGSAKVLKVLPHYLDEQGRMALNPSLYARDAYQGYLRQNPDKRFGMKFDVNWRGRGREPGDLKLRLELRGAHGQAPTSLTLEENVGSSGWFSKWATLRFTDEQWKAFGELTAWRATLWSGDKMVAEQKSFLW